MGLNNIGLFGLIQAGGKREFVAVKGHTNNSGAWPGTMSKKEWAEIRIESDDRYDALDLVIDILEGAGYKWSKYNAPTSTFDAIQVDAGPLGKTKNGNYDATGPKERGTRIIFKFPHNKDLKNFKWWNEALEEVFKNKSSLKKTMSDRNELNVAKYINEQLGAIGGTSGVTLQLGTSNSYDNVAGVVGGSGHQDFRVLDMSGNVVTSISYKAGHQATDFQQYSGISDRTAIGSDEEVVAFRDSVVSNWDSYKKQGFNAMWRDIDKVSLKKDAVFGNAEWFAQGVPSVIKSGTGAKLSFRKLTKDITTMTNGYTPTLGARGGEGSRRIVGKTKSITGVRGGVFTKSYLGTGRKAKDV